MTAADASPPPRVLVVEDDENIRLAVTVELSANGLDVRSAATLAEADRELSAGMFDCVVFDRMLPDGDAIDSVYRRRETDWAVPVLLLTSLDTLTDRVTCFEHG